MEDMEAVVYLLLVLWLFVTNKANVCTSVNDYGVLFAMLPAMFKYRQPSMLPVFKHGGV